MDKRTLIKDLALVAVLLTALFLSYLALRSPEAYQGSDIPSYPNSMTASSSTPSPELKIEVLAEGSGQIAENGMTVEVHYRGTLEDGSEFDSSYSRNQPLPFVLGQGQVIPGWELGVLGMMVGEKRRLTIPPDLAYGADGFPPVIPPNATLYFDVELISAK